MKRFTRSAQLALLLWLLLLVTACNRADKPDVYKMSGEVVSVQASARQATIEHGPIPGFMEAMTMPYLIKDDAELKKLAPGEHINADLMVNKKTGEAWLINIQVTRAPTNK